MTIILTRNPDAVSNGYIYPPIHAVWDTNKIKQYKLEQAQVDRVIVWSEQFFEQIRWQNRNRKDIIVELHFNNEVWQAPLHVIGRSVICNRWFDGKDHVYYIFKTVGVRVK